MEWLLPQRPDRYLRDPWIERHGGGLRLVAIGFEPDGERRWAFGFDGDAWDEGTPIDALARDGLMGLGPGPTPTPYEHADDELRAACASASVAIVHDEAEMRVLLRRDGRETAVFRGRGMGAAPAVAEAPGGHWVAFHHDLREDDGRRDIAKWIGLRFVDDAGEVFAPEAEMTDRDRDLEGEEQSFEFPGLAVGPSGAVAIFGRGSHEIYRQDLDIEGFGPREALSGGGWGSRGRRARAVRDGDALFVTFRDRRGVKVIRQAAPTGEAPALRPAPVEPIGSAPPGRVALPESEAMCAEGRITLFGDVQQHSAHSDGLGSAHEVYLRARDRYADDFVALTDHESFLGKRTGPGEWRYLQETADRYDAPGAFNTILAYEWTGKMHPGPGHKCVYLPERGLPILSRDDLPEGAALVRAVAAQGAIAAPHHVGWTGADLPGHHPSGQPLFEICSCHGCYEHPDHPLGARGEHHDQFIDAALRAGHRFGFTAASDSHGLLYHHGTCRKRDPYRTGLTAVQSVARTREAIFAAMKARRCYATSGVRIHLDVRAEGAPMGSELAIDRPLRHEVFAASEVGLASIELVTEAGVSDRLAFEPGAREVRGTLCAHAAYAYVRVVREDGEMAWSSPIFTDTPLVA